MDNLRKTAWNINLDGHFCVCCAIRFMRVRSFRQTPELSKGQKQTGF